MTPQTILIALAQLLATSLWFSANVAGGTAEYLGAMTMAVQGGLIICFYVIPGLVPGIQGRESGYMQRLPVARHPSYAVTLDARNKSGHDYGALK